MKSTPTKAAVKIRMMKASQRCLVLGLLGLLPLIGPVFGLAALSISFRVQLQEKYLWNPAKPQRNIGLICASFGALIWGLVDSVIIFNLANHYVQS